VLPDPLPAELSGLTPAQVDAYNAAWTVCDDAIADGWSSDPVALDQLTQCLADQLEVAVDDPSLTAFAGWLATTQDPTP
jgi:hypothetical protein